MIKKALVEDHLNPDRIYINKRKNDLSVKVPAVNEIQAEYLKKVMEKAAEMLDIPTSVTISEAYWGGLSVIASVPYYVG